MKGGRRDCWSVLIFAGFLIVLAGMSVACAANTYTVCPSGCNYTTIQTAIDAAQPGDTIEVHSGTYYENVNVNKQLTLQGVDTGGGKPVVDAGGTGSAIRLSHDGIVLDGFTALNAATDWPNAGIVVYSNNNIVINNTANSNKWSGIYLESSRYNNLSGNTASNNSYGIRLIDSYYNNLSGNAVSYNTGNGTFLGWSSTNYLTGNTANSNGESGFYLYDSDDNILTGNIANSNNDYGIDLEYSYTNNLTGNTASNNYDGIYLSSSNSNNLASNTANSNDDYGIYLVSSSSNTLTSNIASNNDVGISLQFSSNKNTLTGNTASNNYDGIHLSSSSSNYLTDNTVNSNGYYGIYLVSSSSNNLASNTANSNGYYGIYLVSSSSNTLTSNIASNNYDGISLQFSSNKNNLTGNTANSNNYHGISLRSSSNNIIYNNYFNNTQNAYDGGNNVWNITKTNRTNIISGPNLGGNYWSDYTGNDTDGDGFGDTPYNIPGGTNKDYLPLVAIAAPDIFDTGKGEYPSIMGTHNGTITMNQTINVSKLYTYPCIGTGGHTEYIKIWKGTETIAEESWNGYLGDWHNISFDSPFILTANEAYNYTIRTGSYPQIIHEPSKSVTGGTINCTDFTDVNGNVYTDWIPAIRLE